jgi:hypothetical protein
MKTVSMNKRLSNPMPYLFGALILLASCSKKDTTPTPITPKDPNTAEVVSVDRFSATTGHLQVRTATNGLPAANAAVNFDQAPFITKGFTPSGQLTEYYNFDVQSTRPDDIYVFFKNGSTTQIAGQINVIPTIPGDAGYSDFWIINKVIVPDNYVPNTLTSEAEILASGYTITKTTTIVNCPVVPKNSTAAKRFNSSEDASLTKGWYKGKVVFYFNFFEKATINATAAGLVPVSPIYVTFTINPNLPNGGPASGFKMVAGSEQTHNVIGTIPTDAGYSPLWNVRAYDNAAFGSVSNLSTAIAAPLLVPDAGNVNCPVVKIQ